jgi:hypothetical protein
VPELRPLELPELPELLVELPELLVELPELPEPLEELPEPELLVPVLAEECCAAAACAEPGSARLTPAAASTLAAPAAAVTARSLDWLRFLAAIAACRSGLPCAAIVVLSPLSLLQDRRRTSGNPLRQLRDSRVRPAGVCPAGERGSGGTATCGIPARARPKNLVLARLTSR